MREHPVPQNITTYQFRLIGNMTVKQFLVLLAGGAGGFLFYSTNLLPIIKWPLVLLSVFIGILMAFVPFEDRTLDQWLVNFIKAIYKPTKFYWSRESRVPEFFSYKPGENASRNANTVDLTPYKRQQAQQFLSSISATSNTAPEDPLDLYKTSTSDNLTQLFSSVAPAADVKPGATIVDEDEDMATLVTKVRPLGEKRVVFTHPEMDIPQASSNIQALPQNLASSQQSQLPSMFLESSSEALEQPVTQATTASADTVALEQVSTTSTIEEEEPKVEEVVLPASAPEPAESSYTAESIQTAQPTDSIPAVFNKNLPFPSLPQQPNVLVGMVYNAQGGIVANAIVEILDEQGVTARAMKTNNLGQFYISSALPSGTYIIETESPNATYPRFSFEADDSVLLPVEIRATA